MKNLLMLITIMLVGGCGKDKETPASEPWETQEITDLDLTPTSPPHPHEMPLVPLVVYDDSPQIQDINATDPKEKKED